MRKSTVAVDVVIGLAATGLILTSCSTSPEFKDAPVGTVQPEKSVNVITMPDHYGNVAYRCGEFGEMIYVTTHSTDSSNLFVVPNSEGCKAK